MKYKDIIELSKGLQVLKTISLGLPLSEMIKIVKNLKKVQEKLMIYDDLHKNITKEYIDSGKGVESNGMVMFYKQNTIDELRKQLVESKTTEERERVNNQIVELLKEKQATELPILKKIDELSNTDEQIELDKIKMSKDSKNDKLTAETLEQCIEVLELI